MKEAIVLLALFTALAGCSSQGDASGRIAISPDGQWAGWMYSKTRYAHRGPETIPVDQQIYFSWASTTDLSAKQSVLVLRDKASRHHIDGQFHFAFSRGGKWAAVVSPERLTFIETATGLLRENHLTGEVVSSMRWLNDETLAYVSYSGSKRTFWRQGCSRPVAERTAIYSDVTEYPLPKLLYEGLDWPREFWSPDGRYALFSGPGMAGSADLLATGTGEVKAIEKGVVVSCASWDNAGRRVFWISSTSDGEDYGGHLLNVAGLISIDLGDAVRDAFPESEPGVEPVWTPDDRFIVADSSERGGCLIQLEPWQVFVPCGTWKPGSPSAPTLRLQPAAGVLTQYLIATDETAISYDGTVIEKLGSGGMSGWTVITDREAVSIWPGNEVVVREIEAGGTGK